MSDRPVALDLCCGLGGWSSGLVAAGWHVIGVDIEDMFAALGEPKPEHFELVLADICKVRGVDYAHVSLIVGSSPCQDFSYRAMPWKRAKAMHAPFLGMWLFWQQFRIQREASEAKGEHVPMVVENVRGAIPWVGRSGANYGSYHVWGDVPALMPQTSRTGHGDAVKRPGRTMCYPAGSANPDAVKGRTGKLHWQDEALDDGRKVPGFRFDGSGRSLQTASVEGVKVPSAKGRRTDPGNGTRFTTRDCGAEGTKGGGSKSPARKAASARIAKIPLSLSSWIGLVYLPKP